MADMLFSKSLKTKIKYMKKIILPSMLILFSAGITIAQCDKKFVLNSSKTEYLDSTGALQRFVDEPSIIEISNKQISIAPDGTEKKMTGPVKSHECNWKVPYKEGKSIIKAALSDQGGETKNVTITIEGKDGVVTFLATIDDDKSKRIRLKADSFQEMK
jgi:hypothetical protein